MVNKVEKCEDAVSKVTTFKDIIKTKKKNVICVVYGQGLIFKRFKEKNKFIKMIKDFGISKLTMIFKINTVKLLDKYAKLKSSSLSLHFMKNYSNTMKEICKENASGFI